MSSIRSGDPGGGSAINSESVRARSILHFSGGIARSHDFPRTYDYMTLLAFDVLPCIAYFPWQTLPGLSLASSPDRPRAPADPEKSLDLSELFNKTECVEVSDI